MRNLVTDESGALLDREDRVAADLLCVRCGANLRGQSVNDGCANCHHPISDSVHGDYLIYSDPVSVRKLGDAARMVLYGALLLIWLTAIALVGTLFTGHYLPQIINNAFDVMRFGAAIAPVIAAVGLVMLTPRRTLAFHLARLRRPRRMTQMCLLAAFVIAVVCVASYFAANLVAIVGLVLWITIPIGAFLRGVRGLMLRIPDYTLARMANNEFIAFLALGIASFGVLLLREYAFEHGWEDALVGLTALICTVGVIVAIRGYILLVRVRDALDRAAR